MSAGSPSSNVSTPSPAKVRGKVSPQVVGLAYMYCIHVLRQMITVHVIKLTQKLHYLGWCSQARLFQASTVSSLPRERLEKLFNDSVKKLKARERELASVTAERDNLAKESQASSSSDDSRQQLEVLSIFLPLTWPRIPKNKMQSGCSVPWGY